MVARRVVARVVRRQVKYVKPVSPPGSGLVASVYEQAEQEMRVLVPPIQLHSPAPEVLAAYWMLLRETLFASGAATRLAKEAVAAAVSVANTCPYCVDIHGTAMYGLTTEHDADAIALDRLTEVTDPPTRAIAEWARTSHLAAPLELSVAGLAAAEVAELTGVAVTFHYLNRMVNVFLTSLLPPGLQGSARQRVRRQIGRMQRPMVLSPPAPGRSLELLPDAALPDDARWASAAPTVGAAVARASAAFDDAGEQSLPADVRHLVLARLAEWRGAGPGLSRGWCEEAIADLPADRRPAARLALLTALASYQVDEQVIEDFRSVHPKDIRLVQATAWASFAAARGIGARLVDTAAAVTRQGGPPGGPTVDADQ